MQSNIPDIKHWLNSNVFQKTRQDKNISTIISSYLQRISDLRLLSRYRLTVTT